MRTYSRRQSASDTMSSQQGAQEVQPDDAANTDPQLQQSQNQGQGQNQQPNPLLFLYSPLALAQMDPATKMQMSQPQFPMGPNGQFLPGAPPDDPIHGPLTVEGIAAALLPPGGECMRNGSEYVCHICDQAFARKFNLKTHIATHFPDREKLQCPNCSLTFYRKGDLQRHRRGHEESDALMCQSCGKRFTRIDHLHRHARSRSCWKFRGPTANNGGVNNAGMGLPPGVLPNIPGLMAGAMPPGMPFGLIPNPEDAIAAASAAIAAANAVAHPGMMDDSMPGQEMQQQPPKPKKSRAKSAQQQQVDQAVIEQTLANITAALSPDVMEQVATTIQMPGPPKMKAKAAKQAAASPSSEPKPAEVAPEEAEPSSASAPPVPSLKIEPPADPVEKDDTVDEGQGEGEEDDNNGEPTTPGSPTSGGQLASLYDLALAAEALERNGRGRGRGGKGGRGRARGAKLKGVVKPRGGKSGKGSKSDDGGEEGPADQEGADKMDVETEGVDNAETAAQ